VTTNVMQFVLDCAVRASVPLGLAWGATALMRRASASTRHFLWVCAISSAAVVPPTMVTFPHWRLTAPTALAPLTTVLALDARGFVESDRGSISHETLPAQTTTADRPVHLSDPLSAIQFDGRAYTVFVLRVWMIGAISVLFYMLVGYFIAWRVRRSVVPVNTPWTDTAEALTRSLGIHGPVAVGQSTKATVPVVCGLWRPMIVMPHDVEHWPQGRLPVVLLHELAHVKRRDALTQALAQVVCAAYWFNPLAWTAARHLRAERERSCDDVVLAAGAKRSEYASHLLEMARAMRSSWLPTPARLAMAHRSQLEARLMAISILSLADRRRGTRAS
jgi:beta-lactamase regulating signal transducer with metallopeptidase domain